LLPLPLRSSHSMPQIGSVTRLQHGGLTTWWALLPAAPANLAETLLQPSC
jgi:hypothetical protein